MPPWLLTIITPILKVIEFFINLFTDKSKKDKQIISYPKKTLILIVRHPQLCWWHMGSHGNKSAMQIVCDLAATNITNNLNIEPIKAILKKTNTVGHALASHYHHSIDMIPARSIREIRVDFWVTEPFCKEGESFRSDIVIIDQFNNSHTVKNILFRYR